MKGIKDLTGNRYHSFIVIGFNKRVITKSGAYYYYWNCKCDCGKEFTVESYAMRQATKKSCGCMRSKASKRRANRVRETLFPKKDVIQNSINKYLELLDKEIPLIKFLEIFDTEEKCLELLLGLKYMNNKCPKCKSNIIETYKKIKTRRSFTCGKCATQIYPTNGTILQKSTTSIKEWFQVLYSICWNKKNISAKQIQRDIESSYTTAHRMSKLRRFALYPPENIKLKGVVEVDEAFLGKQSNYYKWGTVISTRKRPILGFYERETGKVRVVMIEKRDIETLDEVLLKNIEVGSTVYTDGWMGYANLKKYYTHESVNHSEREYVRGDVTTNRIEGFWAQLKKNIGHAHVSVSGKYVENYIDEFVWKFNNRHLTSMQRFDDLLNRILNN